MARSGRRLVIGAAGPLNTDSTLEAPAGRGIRRGEVRGYTTPAEDVSRREQANIEQRSTTPVGGSAGDRPIIIVPIGAGGGADAGGNAGPGGGEVTTGEAGGVTGNPGPGAGPGSSPGESGGDAGDGGGGAGDFKRGGIVTDKQPGKEQITAEPGEYVVNANAVKKYGLPVIEAINRGQAHIMDMGKQDFATGGPVLGSGERFKNLVAQLQAKGNVSDPAAVAASIGRKKYGNKRFASLAHDGH